MPIAHVLKTNKATVPKSRKKVFNLIYGIVNACLVEDLLSSQIVNPKWQYFHLTRTFLPAQRLQRWVLTHIAYQYDIQYMPIQQHEMQMASHDHLKDLTKLLLLRKPMIVKNVIYKSGSHSAWPFDAHLIQHETDKTQTCCLLWDESCMVIDHKGYERISPTVLLKNERGCPCQSYCS